MRPFFLALLATTVLQAFLPGARASDLRHFEDAALHAVQFVDDREGWAVGDEGAVWHSIDGGKNWERQPTGVRASLRSLHFITPFVGWIAGREELPLGAGSAGVLLYTRDGGERWHRMTLNAMPGLNHVCFVDGKTGYAVGDGNDQFPSGAFVTRDGGKNWDPVPGRRCPSWRAAAFTGPDSGALVGDWSRLANLLKDGITSTNAENLGGRNIRSVFLGKEKGQRGVAVGQGALILLTDNGGLNWAAAELLLPPEAILSWDLHAVHGAGRHLWAAGRPGSSVLHSRDGGKNWEMQTTGQPLPINGLFFRDERTGWAVGELGTILGTTDGGRTWSVRQQGGKRAAVLFLHARSGGVPADTVALLGGDEGYLAAAVRVLTPDSTSAAFDRAGEGDRLAMAVRQAGGAAAETLWQFPLAQYLNADRRKDLLKAWEPLHGDKAGEQLLRQLVLAIRVWRPDVVVTDRPDAKDNAAEALVAETARAAFVRAADPKAFPEQLTQLGLKPWKPSKIYAPGAVGAAKEVGGQVRLDLTEIRPGLGGTARDFAMAAAGLLAGGAVDLPRQRLYRLMAGTLAGAEGHRSLMQGVDAAVGDARRKPGPAEEVTPETLRQLHTRANLQAIVDKPLAGLSDPGRLLAAVGPMLAQLPDSQGAAAAHAIASRFVRDGQWFLAREAFLQMVERYPIHPLTADAYRWLIRHNSSSETRRRHELGQFRVSREFTVLPPGTLGGPPPSGEGKKDGKKQNAAAVVREAIRKRQVEWAAGSAVATFNVPAETLRWHQGSLELEPRLAAFGKLLAEDPSIQFCLHAARRNLGDFETPRKWFANFVSRQPPGPWRDAAAAELWLAQPQGPPPKPIVTCRKCDTRPFLDGKFDDACWKDVQPIVLRDAADDPERKAASRDGKPAVSPLCKESPTKVWMTHDNDFLYLALRCERPAERQVPTVKGRARDADLRGHDRVSLFLDLDRDYATCFHFQVDERGCVREDCWGDVSWNPRWFVAVSSDASAWQIEAAIPLVALTGDSITSGRTWACNVVRVLPGQGVQAWSLPAGVPEKQPHLEGMGLLMFRLSDREEAAGRPAGPHMNRAN